MELLLGAVRIAFIALCFYILVSYSSAKYSQWDESWAWDEEKRKKKFPNTDWWKE